MKDNQPKCELCGEPMPEGEEMFTCHGMSGPCPCPKPWPEKTEASSDRELVRALSQFDDVPEVKEIDGLWNTIQECKAALSGVRVSRECAWDAFENSNEGKHREEIREALGGGE